MAASGRAGNGKRSSNPLAGGVSEQSNEPSGRDPGLWTASQIAPPIRAEVGGRSNQPQASCLLSRNRSSVRSAKRS
jgi:hypothetical protein